MGSAARPACPFKVEEDIMALESLYSSLRASPLFYSISFFDVRSCSFNTLLSHGSDCTLYTCIFDFTHLPTLLHLPTLQHLGPPLLLAEVLTVSICSSPELGEHLQYHYFELFCGGGRRV